MKKLHFIYFLLFVTTICYSQNPCPGTPTVDYAGKTYHTVQIGTQCWLKENLNVGIMVDSMSNQSNNGIIEKYCYWNDTAKCSIYGGLYQWNEAMQYVTTQGTKGICPTGWHIPTFAELQTLVTAVNYDGNSLKDTSQGIGEGKGTNTSGFSALLAGDHYFDGYFYSLGIYTYFWSSTANGATNAFDVDMEVYVGGTFFYNLNKGFGFSIRCLKDDATEIKDHSENTLPKSIELLQNFPNPFNPSTTISFTLPERTNFILSVYNELGEKVAVLFNGEQEAGTHNIEWNASKFVSGIYYYELKTEKFTSVKKLILMK